MRNNYQIRFRKEYFLFLLPVFFVLHGYTENFHLINGKDSLTLLLQFFLVSLILCIPAVLFFKSWRRASLFVFLLMSFYFFFGSVHDAGKKIFQKSFFIEYTFILPFSIVLFIVTIIWLKRTKKDFSRFIRYINILLLILISVDLFLLIQKIIKEPKTDNKFPVGFSKCDTCSNPDIYFIIADEYAGRQELEDIFHFDNSGFEGQLKGMGFHIIDSTFSNYNYTPFSMASILSMNYLSGIEGTNSSKSDRHVCYSLINKNNTVDFLKKEGYAFKNFSVFEFDGELPQTHSPFILTGKELLTSQTFLSRLDRDIRFNLISRFKIKSEIRRVADVELETVRFLFTKTKEEVNKTSPLPRFVYTHLMMPHYPYLLDKNGNRTNPEMALEGNQVNQKAYIEYLQYCNGQFLQLFRQILQDSKKPPIIIFMGDHGFRHFTTDVQPNYHFMNFNAIYLPGKNYDSFYNNMSAVNEFRVLFNSEFDQHLPLLKDSMIFLKEY